MLGATDTARFIVALAACACFSWRSPGEQTVLASQPTAGTSAGAGTYRALLAQPGAAIDPVATYLTGLPTTNAQFPALRTPDADAWRAFFDTIPGAVAQLTSTVRGLEVEFKTATSRVEAASREAEAATAAVRRATAALDGARRALVRAKQRSGGAAAIDTQNEEDRVERAQAEQSAASADEQRQLESVGQLQRQRLLKQAELIETRVALQRATARIGPPRLGDIANRELKLGSQTVAVKNHTDVSDSIGVAECEGAAPIILLAPRPSQPISNAAMMFFREHEMAHHVLRHVDCSKGQTARTGGPEQEIEADCEAEKVLSMFQDGQRVVDIVFGHFWTWNQSASLTHPSSRSRANALFTQCK